MLRRAIALAICAVVLYVVAPAVTEVLGAWPRVRRIEPGWFAAMIAAQLGSLWCLWKLQALCIGAELRPVAESSLVSGAVGRVLPGGTATAAATQYAMLTHAGVPGAAIGAGLAAGTLLQLAALCALALLALPAVLLGVRVPTSLLATAAVAAVLFASMVALTALALRGDRALAAAARTAGRVLSRVRRSHPVDPDGLAIRLLAQRDAVRTLLGRTWRLALVVAVGRWVLDFLTLQAALAAIGADPHGSLTLLAYAGAQLLAQVPLTPGGLGVVEAGLAGSLALAGISAGQAAVATLAYRLVSYWLLLPAGFVAWLLFRRREAGGGTPAGAPAA